MCPKHILSTVWAADMQGPGRRRAGQGEVNHRGVYPLSPGKVVSVQAAVVECHRLGGLTSKHYFSCSWRLDAHSEAPEHLVSGDSPLIVHRSQSSLQSVVAEVPRGLFMCPGPIPKGSSPMT